MQSDKRQKQTDPALSFHLMKFAVQDFQKNTSQLTTEEYDQARQQAKEEMLLHQIILHSEEACCVVVPEQNVRQTLARVIAGYQDQASFHAVLQENNLQFTDYLTALHNDLRVETVLARVASKVQSVPPRERLAYYRANKTDFPRPEQRSGAHIQIFSNPSPSAGIDPALLKITAIHHRVCQAPDTFCEEARLHSECDTKKDGGQFDRLVAGDLCHELDNTLFSLKNGAISPVIRRANSFHILQCREILPGGGTMSFSEATPAISSILLKKKQLQACRTWLAELMESSSE